MKKKEAGTVNIFTVAATYMGTIVGAGFASGQEVLQFFAGYGLNGLWGVILTTILFAFFGYVVMLLGQKLQATSHVEVITFANGRILGFFVDVIITIFLFGALAAMIAGAGAVFKEQFGWSPLLGNLLMAGFALITVWTGIKGVIQAISYVVPVLLGSIVFIAIYTMLQDPITSADWATAAKTIPGTAPNWFIASINYVSYNLVIAIAVLAPMGAQAKSVKTLFWGTLLGGLSLGAGVLLILISVLANIESAVVVEIPMIQVVAGISTIFQFIFSLILFAEVYTTAVGNLFGFVSRVKRFIKIDQRWLLVIVTIAAFAVSQFGFSSMVKYLYPAVGYGGIVLLAGLLYSWLFRRKTLS